MAPKPQSPNLPIYPCGSHWHFEPIKIGFFGPSPYPPWYKTVKYPGHGKYRAGQKIYVPDSSETFSISSQLQSGFYVLRDKIGDVKECMGENGRFVDSLYKEEDLSTMPWQDSIPLPSYGAVNGKAYTTGYDGRRT